MRLPPYSGPYDVGAVDIEMPVREPQDFTPDYVDPVRLNKVIRNGKKIHIRDGKKLSEKLRKAREADHKRGTHTNERRFEDEAIEQGFRLKSATLMSRTVLFTLYYPSADLQPSEKRKHGHVRWLGRPKRRMFRFAWNYLGQYGGGAKAFWPPLVRMLFAEIEARVGMPLGDPSKISPELGRGLAGDAANNQQTNQFPVLVFSHGLAGNRLAYSQYCGELASQGFVVAAIEHRDGSGMGGFMWTSGKLSRGAQNSIRLAYKRALYYGANETVEELRNQESEKAEPESPFACQKINYFPFEQVGMAPFSAKQGPKEQHMRQLQLAMRRKEIFEALHVLRLLNAGESEKVAILRTRSLGAMLCGRRKYMKMRRSNAVPHASKFLSMFEGKLDVDHPALAGHSFGGATLIELLRTEQTDFKYGIVLDPWVEPVRDPVYNPNIRGRLRAPLYVINSEAFTMWRSLYTKLHHIMHDATSVRPMEAIHTFTAATLEQIKITRQQIHLSEVMANVVPDDLGASKSLIRSGNVTVIAENANESNSDDHVGTARDAQRRKRKFGGFKFWEFSGWWQMRNQKRSGKKGWLVASNEVNDVGKLLEPNDGDEHEGEDSDTAQLIYLDPRDDPTCWSVPGFDPDAKDVYEHLTVAHQIPEHRESITNQACGRSRC